MKMKDLKLGIKVMKYGLQFKTMVIMFVMFFVLGTAMEISNGIGNMGGIYLVILGTYIYQMIITSSVSTYVSASPKALKLQAVIPSVLSLIMMIIGYTYFFILRFVRTQAWIYSDTPGFAIEQFSGLTIVAALAFVIQVYNAFAYKYYIPSMITMLILEIPIMGYGMNVNVVAFLPRVESIWFYSGLGLVIIIIGGLLGLFCANLVKRKGLDPKTYKAAMARSGGK